MVSLVLVIGTMHRYDNGSIDCVWTSIYVQKMTQKCIVMERWSMPLFSFLISESISCM